MITSCSGQVFDNQRSTIRGDSSSGSHFVTLYFHPLPFFICVTDAVNGARSRFRCYFRKQTMAYKEANPLMFVRIIVPSTARVMNTNNSRCSPWEDKKQ